MLTIVRSYDLPKDPLERDQQIREAISTSLGKLTTAWIDGSDWVGVFEEMPSAKSLLQPRLHPNHNAAVD